MDLAATGFWPLAVEPAVALAGRFFVPMVEAGFCALGPVEPVALVVPAWASLLEANIIPIIMAGIRAAIIPGPIKVVARPAIMTPIIIDEASRA